MSHHCLVQDVLLYVTLLRLGCTFACNITASFSMYPCMSHCLIQAVLLYVTLPRLGCTFACNITASFRLYSCMSHHCLFQAVLLYVTSLPHLEDNFCLKRLRTIGFLVVRRSGEYISLDLFYFVNLTSSYSLIPRLECTPACHISQFMLYSCLSHHCIVQTVLFSFTSLHCLGCTFFCHIIALFRLCFSLSHHCFI